MIQSHNRNSHLVSEVLFNAILGKIGGKASEEVIFLQVVRTKCSLCRCCSIYGLEASPLRKSDSSLLDFVVNRFFHEVI